MKEDIIIRDLGLQPYSDVFKQMADFTIERDNTTKDEIWLVEHPSVFTQGKHSKPEHVLNPHDIPIVETDRGGQVTYHGPGQVVIYFMLDIKRNKLGAKKLVDIVEQACTNILQKHYNLNSHTIENAHGIYINNKKIASLGLRIKQGKSYHGIAINTKMDLMPFSYINPCGYTNLEMCQLSDFFDRIDVKTIQNQYVNEFIELIEL
ncbi:lipoyl(octanoyl) transferase LipB [Francisella orientalis]|uniref:Octanoyltransferase n=1 Tax=Francisella orientalis TaxID=299583 RepID=A0AAP6X6J9_9GAMM|nr:lipoyl(octanoyl) transferase LipB [Francisella orientalis]AFJ43428.1 lipoyltransferase [Francisella orientalis str. Toba 04]AHB98449.1 octanoyltransferase [Francisella orientalis LADL 07-285A]AKN85651.1 Octanoyltransferase [Francisella orientalis FNO12]AKN87191.1 Octanoyltransferase [Francisella orientalis FNO24]AKN88728.1 Octanoyltransferase [Francisella orientalis]